MVNCEEITILMHELGKLIDEYERCTDRMVRENIKEDILLIGTVIHPDYKLSGNKISNF
ncbi:hypothetical protein [Bacillus sp. V5-8f]|uniref:hypothetical protein n=1 Tax=Bacillus sp. V5-8f TaxID=2053044 RepID=UPI0015E0ACCA|nr:hypothetical protein [Bacillus sp. V5-8f]